MADQQTVNAHREKNDRQVTIKKIIPESFSIKTSPFRRGWMLKGKFSGREMIWSALLPHVRVGTRPRSARAQYRFNVTSAVMSERMSERVSK